jgi:hypothetical protein
MTPEQTRRYARVKNTLFTRDSHRRHPRVTPASYLRCEEVSAMDEISHALADGTLSDLQDDLLARAYLYDSPRVYRDAVEDCFEALRAMLARATAAA